MLTETTKAKTQRSGTNGTFNRDGGDGAMNIDLYMELHVLMEMSLYVHVHIFGLIVNHFDN